MFFYSRFGENLEQSLPNLRELILTSNNIQELVRKAASHTFIQLMNHQDPVWKLFYRICLGFQRCECPEPHGRIECVITESCCCCVMNRGIWILWPQWRLWLFSGKMLNSRPHHCLYFVTEFVYQYFSIWTKIIITSWYLNVVSSLLTRSF